MWRAMWTLLAASLVSVSAGLADERSPPTLVTVVDVDGKRSQGTLEELTPERVVLSGDQRTTIATDRIVRLERSNPQAAIGSSESAPLLLLANGDRILARPTAIADDALQAAWSASSRSLRVPLETLVGAILAPPDTASARDALARLIESRTEAADLVVLARGDQLSGEVLEWTGKSLVFQAAAGKVTIELPQLQALAFDRSLISFPKMDGRRQLLQLADGSFLTVKNLTLNAGMLTFDAGYGESLKLPVASLASCRFFGGRIVPLSELRPAETRQTPFLSGVWNTGIDRTVEGRLLQLRKTMFPRGLGVHSRSEIVYAIDGKYESFSTIAGIDDETAGKGSAVFAIDVDGKRVFTSAPQSGKDDPLPVGLIDLKAARRLTLIVDYGPLADIQDHADWCDPVLLLSQ